MPKASLNAFTNGSKMFFLTHVPRFFKAFTMPFSKPSMENLPSSYAVLYHHFLMLSKASLMRPQTNPASPPSTAPIASKTAFATPLQSTFFKKIATFRPSCCQSISRTVWLIVFNMPMMPLEIVCARFAQSTVPTMLLNPVASPWPIPRQSVCSMMPLAVLIAPLMPLPIIWPKVSHSKRRTAPVMPSPISAPKSRNSKRFRNSFAALMPRFRPSASASPKP